MRPHPAGLNSLGTNFYVSPNAGITWSPLPVTNLLGVISLACSADGTHIIAGNQGSGVVPHISVDSGMTWAAANIPQLDTWVAVGCSAAGNFLAQKIWTAIKVQSPSTSPTRVTRLRSPHL